MSAEILAAWFHETRRLLAGTGLRWDQLPKVDRELAATVVQDLLDQGIIGDWTGGRWPGSIQIDYGPFPDVPPASTLEPD